MSDMLGRLGRIRARDWPTVTLVTAQEQQAWYAGTLCGAVVKCQQLRGKVLKPQAARPLSVI